MKKGYTLVELLVATGIFATVTILISQLFVLSYRAQKKALTTSYLAQSVSYAIEYMARAIRMAKKDDITIREIKKDCSGNPTDKINFIVSPSRERIKFRTYKLNECQEFFLEGGRIKEKKDSFENFLTPSDLEVKTLKFIVEGDSPGDSLQPRVTIFLEIQKKNQPETKFFIQTTISQRDIDI